jgi:hypothetical protein
VQHLHFSGKIPEKTVDHMGAVRYNEYMNKEMNFYLKWAGCVLCCAGALCTSLRIDPLNIYLLNGGAVVYLIWAIRIRETNLIAVNAILLTLYAVGLFV